MNQKNLFKTIVSAMMILFLVSCTKSVSESSGDDPALLAFLVNTGGGTPDAAQAICLGNVLLLNTCVGGSDKGQGYSGALCGGNVGETEKAFGQSISTAKATTCNEKAISDSSCNLPANLSPNATVAAEGPFKDLSTCIAAP